MSDVRKASALKVMSTSVAAVGIGAVLYVIVSASAKPNPTRDLIDLRHGAMKKLEVPGYKKPIDMRMPSRDPGKSPPPSPAPDIAIVGPNGKPMKIADLKGQVVVLNLWATWCAPCKVEMPTLAKLQAAYKGKPVEVVAVSIDSADDAAKATLFIAQNEPLKFYHDREMKMPFVLKPVAPGAPTTVIYGKDGLEVGRVAGEADWSGDDVKAVIDQALAAG
jgi:thiol-disulfide isomerase/thioredoxin